MILTAQQISTVKAIGLEICGDPQIPPAEEPGARANNTLHSTESTHELHGTQKTNQIVGFFHSLT